MEVEIERGCKDGIGWKLGSALNEIAIATNNTADGEVKVYGSFCLPGTDHQLCSQPGLPRAMHCFILERSRHFPPLLLHPFSRKSIKCAMDGILEGK